MHLRVYSFASIHTYIAALPALYIIIGVKISVRKVAMPSLAQCLKGIQCQSSGISERKENITIAHLCLFREFINLHHPRQLAHWAAVCVVFFLFL